MKKNSEIIGCSIASIKDGLKHGIVNELIISPAKGTVEFLKVENEEWLFIDRVISFDKVVGIGDAVTIQSESEVIALMDSPEANKLLKQKVRILNAKVIGTKGQLLGEIIDFYIDEQTGKIREFSLQYKEKKIGLDAEYIITYGRDFLVVKDEAIQLVNGKSESVQSEKEEKQFETFNTAETAEEKPFEETEENVSIFLDQSDQLFEETLFNHPAVHNEQQTEKKDLFVIDEGDKSELASSMFKNNYKMETPSPKTTKQTQPEHINEAHDAFRERQINILEGKVVLKDITDEEGNVIVKKDTVLTREDIIKAQDIGPAVVVDLSMNVRGS
ncbi:PRC-barrel domain-containing protein [Bacillus taeanensis]|uniref:PRC-barrel domain-containing protein n=1 Tax=Bacillus taeanensis TaxID=273032 RepID=A0A366Y068_9BACI|nr:PRC-barrel domain-containing protein [Bacillus taeanensis]RBW71587.1 hypothetical protein DS031_02235 [Bacillus taeanensis]